MSADTNDRANVSASPASQDPAQESPTCESPTRESQTKSRPQATPSQAAAASPGGPARAASPDAPKTLGGLARTMVTRGSPRILIALVVACGTWRASLSGWGWGDLVAPLVVLLWWPFQEWLIHTYLLHARPWKLGPWTIDPLQARKHRRHHLQPWDFADISIPLHTYLYAVPILAAVAYLTRGTPAVASGLFVFVALGLHYEWCHFMAHSNYVPQSPLYKKVWRNHRLHHFKNETLWMGVSTRLADLALGTCPDQKSVPRSPTCLTLGVGPARH